MYAHKFALLVKAETQIINWYKPLVFTDSCPEKWVL